MSEWTRLSCRSSGGEVRGVLPPPQFLTVIVMVLSLIGSGPAWAGKAPPPRVDTAVGGARGDPVHPGRGRSAERMSLDALASLLDGMEQTLGWSGIPGAGAGFRVGEPTGPGVVAPIEISDDQGLVGTGSMSLTVNEGLREVSVLILTTEVEGTLHRTLELTMFGQLSILHVEGSITLDDGTVLEGGWLYAAGALVETSGTDPGFSIEVASMLHTVPAGAGSGAMPAAVMGFTLGDAGSFIGNIINMMIHYWRDARIPYTPPEPGDCDGPTIRDTCEEGDVPCQDDIKTLCDAGIDGIPGVSTAFKKCMKGRCGCGGSTFPTIRITCADSSACGPCGSGAAGCNIGGTTEWYCNDTEFPCRCANVVFHEMSHACGALDIPPPPAPCDRSNDPLLGACRIGFYFEDGCDEWITGGGGNKP